MVVSAPIMAGSVLGRDGKADLCPCHAADGHCRRGRKQRLPDTVVKGRIAETCRRAEASDRSLLFAAGHEQLEPHTALPVPVHQHQSAWRAAAQLPDNRATD
jgi:hypothetical protein